MTDIIVLNRQFGNVYVNKTKMVCSSDNYDDVMIFLYEKKIKDFDWLLITACDLTVSLDLSSRLVDIDETACRYSL